MSIPEFIHTSGNLQADRRFGYAKTLAETHDFDAAIDLLIQTIDIVPQWPALPFTLGKYCAAAGRREEALEWFKKSLALDPDDHQGAMLEIELLGNHIIEQAMPPAFVKTLFDQYAPRFDEHLVESLEYSVPVLIGSIMKKYRPALKPARILDLGCGTGLAAEIFAKHASWIEGVDLSEGMLEQARIKGVYQKLCEDDLLAYLLAGEEKFDLLIAADVLIYFGDLAPVFTAVKTRIAPGGVFAFSVQKLSANETPDFRLGKSRRFSHTSNYLTKALSESGLRILACEEHVLRKDRDEDVHGFIYLCGPESAPDEMAKFAQFEPDLLCLSDQESEEDQC